PPLRCRGHRARRRARGCSPISAIRGPTSTTPSAQSGLGSALVEAVAGLGSAPEVPLQARGGLATGLGGGGGRIGEGAGREEAGVGETPNLAARLQALAEPGAVVLAPATRRLLGNLFRPQKLGRHALKGLAEPSRCGRSKEPRRPRAGSKRERSPSASRR